MDRVPISHSTVGGGGGGGGQEIDATPTFTNPCPFLHVLVSSLYCGLVCIEVLM